jgi:hypothetical protein
VKQGDIVRRTRGWTPMRVVSVRGNTVEAVYCGQDDYPAEYYLKQTLVLVTDPDVEFKMCPGWQDRMTLHDHHQVCRQRRTNKTQQTQPEETTMTKLYQTKEETPRFGTLLATNSAGLYVLEMKGSGEVLTFAKTDVEEVKPYTVCIHFLDGSNRVYQYLSRKGDVEVDDLILVKGSQTLARVMRINTASDKATTELVGRKVLTTAFGTATDVGDVVDEGEDFL